MPNLRSEGYKALSKGERFLPKTNNGKPVNKALETILKFTLPIVSAVMVIKGAMDLVDSFKTTYHSDQKR
jgi:hypothetical protein